MLPFFKNELLNDCPGEESGTDKDKEYSKSILETKIKITALAALVDVSTSLTLYIPRLPVVVISFYVSFQHLEKIKKVATFE